MEYLITGIVDFITHTADLFAPVFAASSDDGNGGFLFGAILFLAGPIFFSVTYARYRNKGARHYHEKETPVTMSDLQVYDNFVVCHTGQKSNTIPGANQTKVEGTLTNKQLKQ